MKQLNHIFFTLWSLLNFGGAAAIALFACAIMSLRYDEMHTISTAHDPDPDLTRETVVYNVILQTGSGIVVLSIFAAIFWALNYAIYLDSGLSKYKKAGFWVSCGCSLILLLGILVAGYDCLNTYPQHS